MRPTLLSFGRWRRPQGLPWAYIIRPNYVFVLFGIIRYRVSILCIAREELALPLVASQAQLFAPAVCFVAPDRFAHASYIG